MRAFSKYLKESIVDQARETISPEIFFAPESENPKLKPKVIEAINFGLPKIEEYAPIVDYKLIGSILTLRYNEQADLDVTILVNASDEKLKENRNTLKVINGKLVPGTTHPVNYFVVNDKADFERKLSLADGIFNIKKNQFERKPVFKPFDVTKYWTEFEIAAGSIDVAKGELKRDAIDYENLKRMSKTQVKGLRQKILNKLEKLEDETKELVDLYDEIKQDRRYAFDRPLTPEDIRDYGEKNRLPENVVYKLLEKYHYLDFLHRVEEILGDDKELSSQEADELADFLVNESFLMEDIVKEDARRIAAIIDEFTDHIPCDVSNHKICHSAVWHVKRNGQKLYFLMRSGVQFKFYNALRFVIWDESKWDLAGTAIAADNSYKRIPVRPFQEMIEDIADGTVNGHSYIKYKNYYIDPYLSSAGVSFDNIQKCGKYLDKIYNKIGIKTA